MTERERLERIEAMAALALTTSLYTAHQQYRRDRWKRQIKDALWPLI